jgi:bifunctional non-homologous end joining protein LigD
MAEITIQAGRYEIEITHPDKEMYPGEGITKQEVVEYYDRIAEFMLPHVKGRPLVMHRFPDGIEGKDFYQKTAPDYFPDWIETREIDLVQGGTSPMVVVEKKADLLYLANAACLVPHVWLSTKSSLEKPDRIVFDLDPARQDFDTVKMAAFMLKEGFEERDLTPLVMTTGSKGLHVVIPIQPGHSFDEVRDFARRTAQGLVEREPARLTLETRIGSRKGKVFLDYLRNAYGQTTVAPYGLRALPGAPVATPLEWDELRGSKTGPQRYRMSNIFRRLGAKKDPWKNMAAKAGKLNL